MKKKILGICMIAALVSGVSVQGYAADGRTPEAVFDGSSEIKYNYDADGSFGSAFEGMLPGDERTQEIILRNTDERTVDFYMEVDVIKALEEASEASGAAYQFSLTVTQEGVNNGEAQTIYGGAGDEDAWIGGEGSKGLGDINEVLEEYGANGIKVAALKQGEEARVALKVMLDGITGGNDYQSLEGTFGFAFHASYDDPEVVTQTVKGKDTVITKTVREADKTIIERVKTGDPAAIVPLAILMTGCAAVIVYLIAARKKKSQE